MSRKTVYWASQLAGWLAFVILGGFLNQLAGKPFDAGLAIFLTSVFLAGLGVSHLYREMILRLHWARFNIPQLIPRVLLASVLFAALFYLLQSAAIYLLVGENPVQLGWVIHFERLLSWSMLFLLWSLIYFIFHFFENFRKEEIKNLKWEAARMEIELNKLKSQLNPHFMFNSMNTIKALIDENPKKAKRSIIQLSNILRNTLQMGKKKVIPFEEELGIVKDYLELEASRYEERLVAEYNIAPNSMSVSVPPLMIQTLVENGIKHGIAKSTGGGRIELSAEVENQQLRIRIVNTGQLNHAGNNRNGFGLEGTKQRLRLLYGDKATFSIGNKDAENVAAELVIPFNLNS